MEVKNYFATDSAGNILGSAQVYVYLAGTTTLASGLQNISGASLTNPFTAQANGLVQFQAPDNKYDMRVVKLGRDFTIRIQCFDGIPIALKIKGFNSVTEFGGIGDGVNDDTAAFVNASKSLTSISVPDGSWVVRPKTQDQVDALRAILGRLSISGNLSIEFGGGVFTFTDPMLYRVEGGQNLSLKGATPIAVSISSQSSVSGSSGNYYVTLNVSTVSGINVGDWLHVQTTAGSDDHYAHRGVWEITAVDQANSRITVKNTSQAVAFPTNTITSSSSVVLKTVFKFQNCDGLVVPESTVGRIDNLMFAGNADEYWLASNVAGTEKGTHGMCIGAQTLKFNGKVDDVNPIGVSGGQVSLGRFVGVSGFDQQGIVTENGGSLWGDFAASCNNKRRGFYASTGSAMRCKHISACGNYLDGVITDLGGSIYASSASCASGNGGSGASSTQSGMLIFDSGFMTSNRQHGGSAVENGVLQAISAVSLLNGGTGFTANHGSTIYCNGSRSANNASHGLDVLNCSQARANTLVSTGNGGAGIRSCELSSVVHDGATLTGNTGGPLSLRGGAITLDGSTYRQGISYSSEYRSVNLTTGNAARIVASSGGDDLAVGFDLTASGTFATKWHLRSGTAGFYSESDNDTPFGRLGNRFSDAFATRLRPGSGAVVWTSGAGSPEGVLTAPRGSIYTQTDGTGICSWFKDSGTGNTGWVNR